MKSTKTQMLDLPKNKHSNYRIQDGFVEASCAAHTDLKFSQNIKTRHGRKYCIKCSFSH